MQSELASSTPFLFEFSVSFQWLRSTGQRGVNFCRPYPFFCSFRLHHHPSLHRLFNTSLTFKQRPPPGEWDCPDDLIGETNVIKEI
jgi:hypothetical protein